MDILYCRSGFKKRARQRGIFAARANNADMWFDGFWCLNIFTYDYCTGTQLLLETKLLDASLYIDRMDVVLFDLTFRETQMDIDNTMM